MITITPHTQTFSMPPPNVGNMGVQPLQGNRFAPPHGGQRFAQRHNFFQPFRPYIRGVAALDPEFDGKRLRKSAMRKTVDYNSAIIKMLEARVWQRDYRDRRALQPDVTYLPDLQPPQAYDDNAINAVTTRFVKSATNKMRCPIFCMAWTPEGRRLVTGASSGEFTLWNGLTFNFETILQAHDSPVRTMVWSHNDVWMVTADHAGYVKYWQSNMNNVKMFLAHKEAVRGISFSPNDSKFATCSDDGTIRIWDFQRCQEERILRGHGADVKCVHWHPQKGLIISGSKDNQQPVKLWDPKTGQSLATLHAHKSTVLDIKWNNNGNWLVTASRDHLLKLFDIRNLSMEVQTFRGHKKESSSVAWHPYHEGLFCSGGSDGAILFWHVGADKEVGAIEQAHDSIVWTLAWHPLGHILCSGSNDHSSKFWTRNRPGDLMRDKYNLNTLPANMSGYDDNEVDDMSLIPGMGPEDKVEVINPASDNPGTIPGLDIDSTDDKSKIIIKKVPYSKPIPKNFQAHWNHAAVGDDDKDGLDIFEIFNSLIASQPGVIPLSEIDAESLEIYGIKITVEKGSSLSDAIKGGWHTLVRYINSGAIVEFNHVRPYIDLSDEESKLPADLLNEEFDHDDKKDLSWSTIKGELQNDLSTGAGIMDQDMRHLMMIPPPHVAGADSMLPPVGTPDYGMEPPGGGFGREFPQRQNRGDDRYAGPNEQFDNNMIRNRNQNFRPDFIMRERGDRLQGSFHGRNEGYLGGNDRGRSDFNQHDDEEIRGSFGNGGYDDEEEGQGQWMDDEQWNNDESYRDNNYDWNDDGADEGDIYDEDYRDEDRRSYPPYPQKKFRGSPRGSRGVGNRGQLLNRRNQGNRGNSGSRGNRGGPRGNRGFERGRKSRGKSKSGRAGFKPRGRNPRR